MKKSMKHFIFGNNILGEYPNTTKAIFGMGCFWGVERLFYTQKGVVTTAAGYAGGNTENPTYQQVCTATTGHTEVVLVVFDNSTISYLQLLKLFWENHNPTQYNRQGNDIGSQYRSAIYAQNQQQLELAQSSKNDFAKILASNNFDNIKTEITLNTQFYFAEEYHQQYLAKNPNERCGVY